MSTDHKHSVFFPSFYYFCFFPYNHSWHFFHQQTNPYTVLTPESWETLTHRLFLWFQGKVETIPKNCWWYITGYPRLVAPPLRVSHMTYARETTSMYSMSTQPKATIPKTTMLIQTMSCQYKIRLVSNSVLGLYFNILCTWLISFNLLYWYSNQASLQNWQYCKRFSSMVLWKPGQLTEIWNNFPCLVKNIIVWIHETWLSFKFVFCDSSPLLNICLK